MPPREYDMSKRAAAVEATRRRILEATIDLHTERGILGTSWQDIARKADVAVGTVYKHFPSLDELVPACGGLLMERIRPPRAESAAEIIGDATDTDERLERVAVELFSFYDRGGPHIESDARERQLPAVLEWEKHLRTTVAALVREALRPERPDASTVQLVSSFLDFPTFRALQARGVGTKKAARTVTEMVLFWLRARAASAGPTASDRRR